MHATTTNFSAISAAKNAAEADWRVLDETLCRLAKNKGELDLEIGRCLLAALRARVDKRRGFGSFAEYVERRLGYDARTLKEKLRVARAVEDLPRLQQLLATGERSWSAAREITRVATPETELAWIAATERRTVREIELLVSGRKQGELPSEPKDPLLTRRRIVFELEGEQFALLTEAFERIRAQIGAAASNVEALLAMSQEILGGRPADRASYQTSLTICAACDRTWMRAGGSMVEVSPAHADCARCDGELVGFTRIDEGISDRAESSPETLQPPVEESTQTNSSQARSAGEQPPNSSHCDLDRTFAKLDPELGARGMLRLAAGVFGVPLRSMTPQLKRAMRARDGWRCVVPGCTNFRFIEAHHQKHRAKGGPNNLSNLHSLCTQHHAMVHEGLLSIEGNPIDGYIVRHASGTLYGAPRMHATH